ncbi:hypothetical protein [Listeria booriae]|uniref:hypothetical protein n=1 Tax=Listeria booriae TaxID=1552123 RepID=UPI0016289825|nr:hypothetical protein [Listeria booriae]MBC1235203.1 hypothetical protein [Listeria booriae]
MILDYLDTKLSGQSWEALCISCYRMRYQEEHFREVPANYQGDAGIEGYTKSGIVMQCYCPDDKNYSNDDLYSHQRDKVTKDIGKFLSEKYSKEYVNMGITDVLEWHFVVPTYKDKRIIKHITTKEQEVLEAKQKDLMREPSKRIHDHISSEFSIEIKVAEDFATEISRIVRRKSSDTKINVAVIQSKQIEWTECGVDKVENVKRKLLAINSSLASDPSKLEKLLNIYMTSYVTGIEMLKNLGEKFPDLRMELLGIIGAFKSEVEMRTLLIDNHEMNYKIFNELGDEFSQRLREEFDCFNSASIMEIKNDIIAEWLADCSMEFGGELTK